MTAQVDPGIVALEQTVAPHSVAVEGGTASILLSLPRQGVALVRLRW